MPDPIVQALHLTKIFRRGQVEVLALDKVQITVAPGEFVALMGPSGSGKSTLFNELYHVGVGNAEWPGGNDPNPSNFLLGQQGALDDASAWISSNLSQVSTSYTLTFAGTAYTGSADVTVAPVPLPAAVWTGMALLGAMGGLKGLKPFRTARA